MVVSRVNNDALIGDDLMNSIGQLFFVKFSKFEDQPKLAVFDEVSPLAADVDQIVGPLKNLSRINESASEESPSVFF